MKKRGTLLAVGALGTAAWGVGLAGPAMADDVNVVEVQCAWSGASGAPTATTAQLQKVIAVDGTLTSTEKTACTPTTSALGSDCAACQQQLLKDDYTLAFDFSNSFNNTGIAGTVAVTAGAYKVFLKKNKRED